MNVWQQAVQLGGHPGYLVETAQKIFNLLGYSLDICLVRTKPVFSNHWLVKPEIFEAYVKGLLLPAMQIMENNKEIKALCYQDSNYAQTVRRDEKREPLSPEQCQRIFERSYYTLHPFICERLFSTWIAIQKDLQVSCIL